MIWSQKMCRKCIFQQSGDANFKHFPLGVLLTQQTLKKLNIWEKTALEKSAWIKACIDSSLWWNIYSLSNNSRESWTPLPPSCAILPALHLPHHCIQEASGTYFYRNIFDSHVFILPQCLISGFNFHSYLLNFTTLICYLQSGQHPFWVML